MAADIPTRPLILLLEDEAALAAAIVAHLEKDFEIELAGNVEEARLLLGTRKFDLIISDHMMPGKDQGMDFLLEALHHQPKAKRILMTGYVNPELLDRSVALAQLSACLVKPVEFARLRRELHYTLST